MCIRDSLDPVTNTGYPVEPVPTSWVFGFDGSESLLNTTVTHDVFRNVAYDLNFQAVEFNPDSSVGTSNYTTPGLSLIHISIPRGSAPPRNSSTTNSNTSS